MRTVLSDYDWPDKVFEKSLLEQEYVSSEILEEFPEGPERNLLQALLDVNVATTMTRSWEMVAVVNAIKLREERDLRHEGQMYSFAGEFPRELGDRCITGAVVNLFLCSKDDHIDFTTNHPLKLEEIWIESQGDAEQNLKYAIRDIVRTKLYREVSGTNHDVVRLLNEVDSRRNSSRFYSQLLESVSVK